MTPLEMFNAVTKGPWKTVGLDLQYRIEGSYVFLQASSSISDWLNNFDFPVVAYRASEKPWFVHRGFKRVYKSGEQELLPQVLDIRNPCIVGYSHGGPIAKFLHEAYWWRHRRQPDTLTFGDPRFCWFPPEEIKGRFSKVVSFHATGDLVTHVPPLLFGYQHVGHVIKLGGFSLPSPWRHTPTTYREVLKGI